MRILFSSTAGEGHLRPLLPLAKACRDAGHDVLVAVASAARKTVDAQALEVHPLASVAPQARAQAGSFDHSVGDIVDHNILVVREVFGRLEGGTSLPGVREAVDSFRPDVIVREPFDLASWLVAEAHDIPTVLVPCCTWKTMGFVTEHLHAGVPDMLEEMGVQPPTDPSQGARKIFTATPAALEVGVKPRVPVHRMAPEVPVGARRPTATPTIYVTFGTVAVQIPPMLRRIGPVVCEALAGLDARVVFTLGRGGDAELLGPSVPPTIEVRDFVPQAELLPETSLVIAHGGYGTSVGGAMTAGVPLLALPLFAMDQWDTSAAIAEAGAGKMLDVPDQTPEQVRAAVEELLADERFAQRAGEIAAEVGTYDTPERLLQRLAAH